MNTLDDLMKFLTLQLRVTREEAISVLQVAAKTVALKYEAELFKAFDESDIKKANALSETEAKEYLHARYEQVTGQKALKVLDEITDLVATEMMKRPRDYFNFSSN